MGTNSRNWSLKVGFLLVALMFFLFNFWEFIFSTLHRSPQSAGFWILFTEQATLIGEAFRLVASFIALATTIFFITKRGLSRLETMMSLRWILVGEAVYWFSFLPSAALPFVMGQFRIAFLIEDGIPCLVEAILMPVVLLGLFFALNPNKPMRKIIKWGMIAGTSYIFVLWLNNMGNWVYAVMQKGTAYIVDYPLNMISFIATTIGLLVLTLYAAYFTKKSIGIERIADLDFRTIGNLVTLTGLYFAGIYVMWIIFGSVGGWGAWYQRFLGHNMDLWVMCLPLVGVPLMLAKQKSLNSFQFAVQAVGAICVGTFLAAYLFALPSYNVLPGELVYRTVIGIFGGLFLLFILTAIIMAYFFKSKDR